MITKFSDVYFDGISRCSSRVSVATRKLIVKLGHRFMTMDSLKIARIVRSISPSSMPITVMEFDFVYDPIVDMSPRFLHDLSSKSSIVIIAR